LLALLQQFCLDAANDTQRVTQKEGNFADCSCLEEPKSVSFFTMIKNVINSIEQIKMPILQSFSYHHRSCEVISNILEM